MMGPQIDFCSDNIYLTLSFHIKESSSKICAHLGFCAPFFNWDSCKAEHPPRTMELQEKEAQKDYSIQEICLERTYS